MNRTDSVDGAVSHQAGFAHSALGARVHTPTRIEVCGFLGEALLKTRPDETIKNRGNRSTDGEQMQINSGPQLKQNPFAGNPMFGHPSSPSRVRFAAR